MSYFKTPNELALEYRVKELQAKLAYSGYRDDAYAAPEEEMRRPDASNTLTVVKSAELAARVSRFGVLQVEVRVTSTDDGILKVLYQEPLHKITKEDAVRQAAMLHERFVKQLSQILHTGSASGVE